MEKSGVVITFLQQVEQFLLFMICMYKIKVPLSYQYTNIDWGQFNKTFTGAAIVLEFENKGHMKKFYKIDPWFSWTNYYS